MIYIAFTYPYTLEDIGKAVDDVKDKAMQRGIYFKKKTIIESREGRPLELITLSSMKGITKQIEPPIEGDQIFKSEVRPYMFEGKRTILITARVHCGETPGSYML